MTDAAILRINRMAGTADLAEVPPQPMLLDPAVA